MAGLVTQSPGIISATTFARYVESVGAAQASQRFGPFLWNGYLYVVGQDNLDPPGQTGIFSSPVTDGINWTRQDVANQPVYEDANPRVAFDDATGLIRLVYTQANDPMFGIDIFHNTFQCSAGGAGSYGTEVGITPPGTMASNASNIDVLSNGDLYAYYEFFTGGTPGVDHFGLEYMKFSGGVWSGPVVIDQRTITANGNVPTYLCSYVDSLDRIGFIYAYWTNYGAGTADLLYRQISALGVVGSSSTIHSYASAVTAFSSGRAMIVADTVLLPLIPNNLDQVQVLTGTTLAAPTWAFSNADPGGVIPHALSGSYSYPIIVPDKDGNPTYFVIAQDFSGSPIDQIWMVTFSSGVWQTPILFQDSVTNPPLPNTIPYPTQHTHGSDAINLADGTWVYITAYEFEGPAPDFADYCTGFSLTTASPVIPLSLACPMDGGTATIGVPYDKTLIVTGGTGPFTFRVVS